MSHDDRHHDQPLPADLQELGEAIGRMETPTPPPDLADRTLARLHAGEAEVRASSIGQRSIARLSVWLRPINSTAGRVAAAFLLLATMGLFTNPVTGERIGRMVEGVIGAKTTDRIEGVVDKVLTVIGPMDIKHQDELADRQLPNEMPRTEAPRHKRLA